MDTSNAYGKESMNSSEGLATNLSGESDKLSLGDVGKTIKKHPLATLGALVVVGAGLGAYILQTRRINRTIGKKPREMTARAKAVGRTAMEETKAAVQRPVQEGKEAIQGREEVAETEEEAGLATVAEMVPDEVKSELEQMASGEPQGEGRQEEHLEKTEEASNRKDLNELSYEDLCAIPGVSEYVATRVVEYRDSHGPIIKFSELKQIKEIDEEVLSVLEENCFLIGPQ